MYDKDFAKRIDIAIEKIGGEKMVNHKLNFSAPTLKRWKDGTSDPKMSNLIAFAQAAEVSLDWLLTGVGNAELNDAQAILIDDDLYYYIPLYDIEASAGHGAINTADEAVKKLAFRKDWLQSKGLYVNNLDAIYARGDSMEPTIPNGATLLIDKARNYPFDGKIYIIRIGDSIFVKRVQRLINGGIRLISDNSAYHDLELSRADLEQDNFVEILGQVIHLAYDLPS